jgi:hypothetical protein
LKRKNEKDLEKKFYTYDYNGKILIKKKNVLRYPLYHQITAGPEMSLNETEKSVEVIVVERRRGGSLETNGLDKMSSGNLVKQ